MKLLFDFLPIFLFFIAYKLYDIYTATIVAIVASCLQVAFFWIKYRRVETMHIITMVLIVVLGGATLIFKDETFIKWKPTGVNWMFGIAFIASQFIGKKTILERMMGTSIKLPAQIWTRLNTAWALFFIFLGVINLYVAYNYDTDTWVNFKLFGMMGLTIIFIILQSVYLSRHIKHEEDVAAQDPKEGP